MTIKPGWHFVKMKQVKKAEPDYPDFIKDWVEFDGEFWLYGDYEDTCVVTEIIRSE